MEPLAKVDALLVANTHYPLVMSALHSALPNADVIDPSSAAVSEILREIPEFAGVAGTSTFLTTGDPSTMRWRAKELYGVDIDARSLSISEPKLAA